MHHFLNHQYLDLIEDFANFDKMEFYLEQGINEFIIDYINSNMERIRASTEEWYDETNNM